LAVSNEAKGIQSNILATERAARDEGATPCRRARRAAVRSAARTSGELMMAAGARDRSGSSARKNTTRSRRLADAVARRAPGCNWSRRGRSWWREARPHWRGAPRLEPSETAGGGAPEAGRSSRGRPHGKAGRRPSQGRTAPPGRLSRGEGEGCDADHGTDRPVPTGRDFVKDMEDFGEGYVADASTGRQRVGARSSRDSARDAGRRSGSPRHSRSTRAAPRPRCEKLALSSGGKHGKAAAIRPLVSEATTSPSSSGRTRGRLRRLTTCAPSSARREARGGAGGKAHASAGSRWSRGLSVPPGTRARRACAGGEARSGREVSRLSFHRVTTRPSTRSRTSGDGAGHRRRAALA
jgi:hypothetical protein